MKRISFPNALLSLLFFIVPQARAFQLETLGAKNLPATEVPAAPDPGRPASSKKWTVLIYVSARNNLGLEAIKDVNEMEAAGSTDRVNVVVEMGRIKCDPPFNPFASVQEPLPPQADWTGVRRFLIKKDSDPLTINSPALAYYPDADMGDWKHLAEFISWGKANYPAEKYLLVVGGHGSGWRGVKPPPGAPKGISYDEVSGNHISPAELAQAIKAGGGVNVYASDACLMQTMEVIYELKDSAEYIVGSQETTPGSGYNYEVFLKALAAAPGDAFSAAQSIMKGFSEYYGSGPQQQSVTMSIVRPAHAAEMAAKMDKFARLVAASPADMKLYHDKKFGLRSYDDEDARDLYQLMKLYYDNTPTPAVKEAAREIIVLLSEKLVARNDAVGYKSKDSNGLSVYFPIFYMNYKAKYEYLAFSAATYWDEMVKAVVESKK
ncbi:MAG: clostripain-related cysteine peptidase [Elusimicrobiales bacterium]|nr:clostripain-related cysteine peptidase [Elusimicrobiales bacterium]